MLTVSGVTYRIAGRTLLDQASAQIAEGRKVGLVGRNGAGKSTLLDLIRGAATAHFRTSDEAACSCSSVAFVALNARD